MTITHKLHRILNDFPITDTQYKFCKSVADQIATNPLLYPTAAQKKVVDGIFVHYLKRQPDDVEKMAMEAMGVL